MASSLTHSSSPPPPPSFLPTNTHRHSIFSSSTPFLNFHISKQQHTLHLSSASNNQNLEVSWLDKSSNDDDYGGWAIVEGETHLTSVNKKKGFSSYLVTGEALLLIAAIAYTSFTQKGFKFNLSVPSSALQRLLAPANPSEGSDSSKTTSTSASNVKFVDSVVAPESFEQAEVSEVEME